MAPGTHKRKRPDRQFSHDDASGRPSPHRPENLGLAQSGQQHGGQRGGRGGGGRRHSRQGAQSPVAGANAVPVGTRNPASPAPAPQNPQAPQRLAVAVDSSRPATPSQPLPALSQPPADVASKAAPAPYLYEYVTDSAVGSWQEEGRLSIQKMAEEADEEVLSTIMQELIRSSLDDRIDATDAGAIIRQVIAKQHEGDDVNVESLLLNTLSLLDESDMRSSKLLLLVTATDVDPEVIRQELDIPILQALSLVRTSFTQMRTRKTTNILYRQANFNLLREESEGYAKLITEYYNTASEAVWDQDVSAENAFQRIKALVGSFDLDVGRVLDITLDISANLLVRAYTFFVKFYRCSSWWPDGGVLDGVKWQDQGFGSLPQWALPTFGSESLAQNELDHQSVELASMKEERDTRFWKRVEEVGMDAFFEIGVRKIIDFEDVLPTLEAEVQPEYDTRSKEINVDRRRRINENRRYMRETKALPPPGNSDAAQLLGFKLRFYTSPARDAQDVLPDNLIFLAALLIKIGFISLRDLYPHLYPPDEKMPEERVRLEKEKAEKEAKERPGGGVNALAMSGALPDDTLPVPRHLRGEKERSGGSTPKQDKKDAEAKPELPAPANQKIMLLKALLLIGAMPEALYMLGRFPWLVDADTTLPAYLFRVAKHMLSKVAIPARPMSNLDGLQDAEDEIGHSAPRADGTVNRKPRDSKKATRWLGLDQVDNSDGQTYRFYYLDWADNIPLCQNVDDVVSLCNSFLGYLGVKIGQDAALLTTLVRIAKYSLSQDGSEANRSRWLELMRRLLVPALSLSKHNTGLTEEVYELLMFFPTAARFNIYAEWFIGKTSRLPDIRVAFDHNKAEVKDVLRRVTNESGKKQARALATVSLSSPGIVTMNMINQLESYSNMIPSLVECTRYFSSLANDVLTWCLINSLSGQGRDRMQADGMLTSSWLQALSQFVASLFFKYSVINPSPVLQCLASELRAGNSTDLEMFEQVLAEMAGIRSDMEFNDAQVLAMAGGEHLQARIVLQLADKRYSCKTTAQRLIKALADPGLIGQTLIAIAQERQMYPHHESSKYMPLKVLGNNTDKIHAVFAQYLDVLKTNLKPSDFESAVPEIASLVGDFGLEPGIAFTICRTAIVHRISEYDIAQKQESEERKRRLSQEQAQVIGDVEMQGTKALPNGDHPTSAAVTRLDGVHEDARTPEPTQAHFNNGESKSALTPQPNGSSIINNGQQPWHPILEPVIQRLSEVSPRLAERVSMPFFVTFWTLTLQDILVHPTSYDNEISKLQTQLKEINANRSDMSALALKDREKRKKALADIQDKLRDELKGRIAAYQKTRNRLSRREKDHWFSRITDKDEIDARHLRLLQDCFLPRSLLSSLDAHYCYLMLKILHDNGTPGFSTMHLLNQLMRKQGLAAVMFQCTAMEAQHFGRFLCETLKLLQHWHADQATYEKEALGGKQKLPGFAKTVDANGEPEAVLNYENFRRILYNWHAFLNGALQMCFESGEYMHIRNGIIVLKAVVPVFPSLNFMGHNMVKQVTRLSEEDSRQDLKLAAMSLLGPLRNREKQWIMPQAFRLNDPAKEASTSGSRSNSTQPETPQPGDGTPRLNTTAPDFKPAPTGLVNGVGRKESIAVTEDGEIEDEKQGASGNADAEMKDVAVTQPTPQLSRDTEKQEVKDAAEKGPQPTKEAPNPASKPSTPAPVASRPPPPAYERGFSQSSRPSSTQPTHTRPSHVLPSKPGSQPPNKPLPALPTDRSSGRYPGRSDDRYGRLDRPNDLRPGSRDHSPSGRSQARAPERDQFHGAHEPSRGPSKDGQEYARPATADDRHLREDQRLSGRREPAPQAGNQSRPSYDSHERANGLMGPPPTQRANPDRANYINAAAPAPLAPQQSPQPSAEATHTIQNQQANTHYRENPARLALINDDGTRGRDNSRDAPQLQKDARRDGQENREERTRNDTRLVDGRAGVTDSSRETQARAEQPSDLAPTGPRRGRLSRDFGPQGLQESSYGRLNGPQDAPSGPKQANGPSSRAGRSYPQPQAPANARPSEPPPPSTLGTRPPESPAALRPSGARHSGEIRAPAPQSARQSSSNAVPTIPNTESGPPVHPSRAGQVGMQPPPIQTRIPANNSRNAGSPTSAPPSGPRGPNGLPPGTPTGPSPLTSGPPLGPSMERQRRGTRQRADINATLQGVNGATGPSGQGVSFRGAAQNRQPSASMSSAVTGPPVQALATAVDPPTRRNDVPAARHEGPSSRSEPRTEVFQGRQDRPPEPEDRTARPREGERYDQQRNSRNSSRDRRQHDEPPQRPPPPGTDDRREKHHDVHGDRRFRQEHDTQESQSRDSRDQSRPSRNDDVPPTRPPPHTPGSFSGPPPWDRMNDGRGPRRDGPEDNRRGGRGPGRQEDFRGAPREEQRRNGGGPPRDESQPPYGGRKRRHEADGSFDDSKRRRSGR